MEVIDKLPWSDWKAMPSPSQCREIKGPEGPGVYQIRNSRSKEYIQFGIGQACSERMKSLFPKPYGRGTRNNENKRNFILLNWKDLEYRTIGTDTREKAKSIEDFLKSLNIHLYNT